VPKLKPFIKPFLLILLVAAVVLAAGIFGYYYIKNRLYELEIFNQHKNLELVVENREALESLLEERNFANITFDSTKPGSKIVIYLVEEPQDMFKVTAANSSDDYVEVGTASYEVFNNFVRMNIQITTDETFQAYLGNRLYNYIDLLFINLVVSITSNNSYFYDTTQPSNDLMGDAVLNLHKKYSSENSFIFRAKPL